MCVTAQHIWQVLHTGKKKKSRIQSLKSFHLTAMHAGKQYHSLQQSQTKSTNKSHPMNTGRQAGKPLLFLGAPCQPFFRKSFFTVILSFALCFFGHRTYILSSLVSNILSTTNNKQHQQTTNNKQETTQTNNKQQTTNNEQWTMNNEQDTSRSTTTSTSTTTIIIIDYITEKL